MLLWTWVRSSEVGQAVFEEAARSRATESNYLEAGGHMSGAIYLAGYVVECKLKALLSKMGKPYPRSGAGGHDLLALWKSAGFRHQDLTGFRRAFIEYWNTSLRYSATTPSEHAPADLLRGARELASYVTKRTTYTRGIRNRGAKS